MEADLAVEALDVTKGAIRRLMTISGCQSQQIETESKRVRRLAARLREDGKISREHAHLVSGALAMEAALHRSVGPARAGRGVDEADVFERAARVFADYAVHGDMSQGVPTVWPEQCWPIGHAVIEAATQRKWWIDEHDPNRPGLIGVVPDEGALRVQWMPKTAFVRPAARGGRNR